MRSVCAYIEVKLGTVTYGVVAGFYITYHLSFVFHSVVIINMLMPLF